MVNYQVKHYIAHPYSAYENGLNENFNGILRRHFPKGTDFSKVSQELFNDACMKINQKPLMMFNFKTTADQQFEAALNRLRGHRNQVKISNSKEILSKPTETDYKQQIFTHL
ncbi:hypothetical protein IV68_GL000334 [Weissella halotolerans DSM 20190]|uniref:Transposase n=2 Tax=Weissella halotolerans TaxID=1615 RepID=A0A0R2FZA7_9LACO|nr:hypothetical protein IV68_GL000334 [Weissella halotolerans DSM 20190]